jgi:hypothetical protein
MSVEDIVLHQEEILALGREEWFRRSLQGYGTQVVARARQTAPRHTGVGADSIHVEMVLGPLGWEARVSWDVAHRYMRYLRSHAIQDAAQRIGR